MRLKRSPVDDSLDLILLYDELDMALGSLHADAFLDRSADNGRGVIYDTLFRDESIWVELVPVAVVTEGATGTDVQCEHGWEG